MVRRFRVLRWLVREARDAAQAAYRSGKTDDLKVAAKLAEIAAAFAMGTET